MFISARNTTTPMAPVCHDMEFLNKLGILNTDFSRHTLTKPSRSANGFLSESSNILMTAWALFSPKGANYDSPGRSEAQAWVTDSITIPKPQRGELQRLIPNVLFVKCNTGVIQNLAILLLKRLLFVVLSLIGDVPLHAFDLRLAN